MTMRKQTLVLAAAIAFVGVAAPALYANDSHDLPGATESHGMLGGGGMMGRSGQMISGCGFMMQGGHGGRPNEQWRKKAPGQPDRNG